MPSQVRGTCSGQQLATLSEHRVFLVSRRLSSLRALQLDGLGRWLTPPCPRGQRLATPTSVRQTPAMNEDDWEQLRPWEIGERTRNLSETGQQLAKKARERMSGVPLKIDVSPFSEAGVTARQYDNGTLWVAVVVYAERVPSDGSGDVDYNLAHELGHAIRIATGVEPKELQVLYRRISEDSAFRPTNTGNAQEKKDAKAAFMKAQPEHVRKMIVDDEIEAWAIARDLFDGIPHDKERLAELERESVAGYQKGLLL